MIFHATLLSILGMEGLSCFLRHTEGGTNENNKRFFKDEAAG